MWRPGYRLACLAVLAWGFCLKMAWAQPDYHLRPQKVAPGIYVVYGALADANPRNGGNTVNTGFLVGRNGVIVINSGPSYLYGRALRRAIRGVTRLPVVLVIDTRAQPSVVLGNPAFGQVPVLADVHSAQQMARHCRECLLRQTRLVGHAWMAGSRPTRATWVIRRYPYRLTAAGRRMVLYHFGTAKTNGDLAVLDLESGVLFSGGMVSIGRLPDLHEGSLAGWIAALKALRRVPAHYLVPDHGPVTVPARMQQTEAYLEALQRQVQTGVAQNRDVLDVMRMTGPAVYAGWVGYTELHPQNIQHAWFEAENKMLAGTHSTERARPAAKGAF